ISILDQDGKNLSSRNVRVKNENLMIPFNLESLPAGEYQVKIVTDEEEVIYKVETKENSKTVAALPLMAYGKTLDENTVNLTVIGLLEPGVEVKVYSKESHNVIYTEHIEEAEGFKKDYTFSKMKAHEIYLEVTDAKGRTKTLYF